MASPNTRLEIARCLRAMGKTVAAYAELGRTVVEAKEMRAQDKRYGRAFDAATAERSEIEPQLGFLTLTVRGASEATRVSVGGEEIRRAAWAEPVPVEAGTAQVVVDTPGVAPVTRAVTIASGQRMALDLDAREGTPPDPVATPPASSVESPAADSPTRPGWLRTGAYVAGGVGVAGLVAFSVLGVLAHSTYSDLSQACGNGPCPSDKADEVSSGKSQQTMANVGLAIGVRALPLARRSSFCPFQRNRPRRRRSCRDTGLDWPAGDAVRGSLLTRTAALAGGVVLAVGLVACGLILDQFDPDRRGRVERLDDASGFHRSRSGRSRRRDGRWPGWVVGRQRRPCGARFERFAFGQRGRPNGARPIGLRRVLSARRSRWRGLGSLGRARRQPRRVDRRRLRRFERVPSDGHGVRGVVRADVLPVRLGVPRLPHVVREHGIDMRKPLRDVVHLGTSDAGCAAAASCLAATSGDA